MNIFSAFLLAAVASAAVPDLGRRHTVAYRQLRDIVDRQVRFCELVPAPATCERSCGPGFIQCALPPYCYNPSIGHTCCSDGTVCLSGSYCSDNGCCPDDISLEECGATVTLSTLLPPSSTREPTTSTRSTASTVSVTLTHTSSSPLYPTGEPSTTTSHAVPSGPLPTNGTATSVLPPVVTAGAGRNADFGTLPAIAGLGLFLMAL
jgi:hypothetical protein